MNVYYNEFDKRKCAALSQLMKDGHITKGEIDDRSIRDVRPDDLKGFERCHFFAGIGLWDYALNLAGWGDRPVWTGSCPCQPFSTAGKQRGKADDRHLWPEWYRLISECEPATIFGEQVASAVAKGWLDDVYQGLEEINYAVGSAVLPAVSVGAPHRRDRLWFVADADINRCKENRQHISKTGSDGIIRDSGVMAHSESELRRCDCSREREISEKERNDIRNELTDCCSLGNPELHGYNATALTGSPREEQIESGMFEPKGSDSPLSMGNPESVLPQGCEFRQGQEQSRGTCEQLCNVADTQCNGQQRPWELSRPLYSEESTTGQANRLKYDSSGHWKNGIWIDCPDGKQRLVEPRIPLLANGYPERVGLIHCAGDAIVPQVAAEFIRAYMEVSCLN